MHPKWEYLVEGFPAPSGQAIGIVRSNAANRYIDPIQEYLNVCGEQGWELVQVSSRDSSPCNLYSPNVVFVFKRLKI